MCELTAGADSETYTAFLYRSRDPAKFGYAHTVTLDRRGVVKYVIAKSRGAPLLDLLGDCRSGSAIVVLADVGVSMHQRVSDRRVMPDDVQLLHKRWVVGSGDSFSRGTQCQLCSEAGLLGCAGSLRTCPMCYFTLHPACARELSSTMSVMECPPLLHDGAIPETWNICALCAVVLHRDCAFPS